MLRPYTLRGRSLQRRHVDPPTLGPRLERQLCELHALRALAVIVREWRVRRDVTQEHLPLHFEGVVGWPVVGDLLPLGIEVEWVRHVGVPHRPRCGGASLRLAAPQAGDGAAERDGDMDLPRVVAVLDDTLRGGVLTSDNTWSEE